jgi:hypothetical protein
MNSKVVPVHKDHAMKTCKGVEVKYYTFITLPLDRVEWNSFTIQLLYPQGNDVPVPRDEPQSLSGFGYKG